MRCEEKKRYRGRHSALLAAKTIMRMRVSYKLYTYLCNECRYWHLTKSPRKVA